MTKDKTKHNCSNCSAFGKHCPHKVNGDPYHYDCGMTVEDIEKENAELKETVIKMNNVITETFSNLTKAKELLQFVSEYEDMTCYADELEEIKQFLSEVENDR